MKSKMNTFSLCSGALMAAVICIMTMIVQIPIPLGYAHLGDAFILLTVAFLGKREGVWAGGIGSAMADLLTGYTQWVIPTLIIKAVLALIAGLLMFDKDGHFRLLSLRNAGAAIVSMAWMVFGYVVIGGVMYGSMASGLASAPGLLVKSVLNIAVYFVIAGVFEKAHVRTLIAARS